MEGNHPPQEVIGGYGEVTHTRYAIATKGDMAESRNVHRSPQANGERPPARLSPASRPEVMEHLSRVLASAEFEHSDRSRPLLRFLVESAVEGRESELIGFEPSAFAELV